MSSSTKFVVALLFLLSGACGLVYEVVWVRMLGLVFGVSVQAVSTVLAAFMAGLALGSVWIGRRADRGRDPLRTYAHLELGIGLFALAFPWLLAELNGVYTWLYRWLDGSPGWFAVARLVLAFLLLLVPTTLMGATLPVLSKALVRRLEGVGRGFGALYALNTLGAALGCVAAAYLLVEWLGTAGATYLAASANLLIAAVSYLLSRRLARHRAPPSAASPPAAPAAVVPGDGLGVVILWGFAASGFCALAYQVVWTRLLCTALRITTIQSLSTILVVFLFGLAAGAAVGAPLADRLRRPHVAFAVAQFGLGFFGLASIGILYGLISYGLPGRWAGSWAEHLAGLLLVGLAVMGLPTLLLGALMPIVGRIRAVALPSLGRRIGGLYAANTTGAIAGAALAGFVLVPWLGSDRSLQLLAAVNVGVGCTVLLAAPAPGRRRRWALLAAGVLAVVVVAVALPWPLVPRLLERFEPLGRLVYHDEDAGGVVTIHQRSDGMRVLRVNGAAEVPTDHASIQTFRLLGNLPLVLHDRPQDVLVIAFGGGITLASVERHRPRRVDCIEVAPAVVAAAPFFARYNNRVYERLSGDRLRLIFDDGRNHVLRTPLTYDVIISDATHPATADSWVLYTAEFYALCERRLRAGGLMAQWLPLHGLGLEDFRMILRTFAKTFPHASLWVTEQYAVVLGSREPLRIDFDRVTARLSDSAIRTELDDVDLEDPVAFLGTLALGERAFAEFAGVGPINTDGRPYISFGDRLREGTQSGLPAMLGLAPHLIEALEADALHASTVDRERVARRLRARRLTFLGEIGLRLGDRPRALASFRGALRVDPSEPGAQRALWRLEPPLAPQPTRLSGVP